MKIFDELSLISRTGLDLGGSCRIIAQKVRNAPVWKNISETGPSLHVLSYQNTVNQSYLKNCIQAKIFVQLAGYGASFLTDLVHGTVKVVWKARF